MYPNIISLGELLVEIMRDKIDVPHNSLGSTYKGPYPSGAPAIFIDSAARMGKNFHLTTGVIGIVGNDAFGECIINKLKKDQVDVSQIKIIENLTTGVAFNQYNSDGTRKFIFAQGAAGELTTKDIKVDFFKNVKNLHIMGSALSISEKSRDACYMAVKIAKEKNPDVVISFDPNLRSELLNINTILDISKPILENTKILLPSEEEAETLAGVKGVKNSCQKLLSMGPSIIAVKKGKNGCTIFTKDNHEGEKIDGFNVIEKDPTGAGDSFDGAFVVGYLVGWDLKRTAKFANAIGALKVESFGPMPDTTYKQALDFINN
jgi:sugar/nucleoside kinase (ribokinase family)